ncbi:MAG TPA: hypothetical protein PLP33_29505 [Leptospiraceae bacterium]|nr:hypothetical protein [Leptospiraceae bacterium]
MFKMPSHYVRSSMSNLILRLPRPLKVLFLFTFLNSIKGESLVDSIIRSVIHDDNNSSTEIGREILDFFKMNGMSESVEEMWKQVFIFTFADEKIVAIQYLRILTGEGLVSCKQEIDKLQEKLARKDAEKIAESFKDYVINISWQDALNKSYEILDESETLIYRKQN